MANGDELLQARGLRDVLRSGPQTHEPLYKQVKREIITSLTQKEWKPGGILPSESRLAARFQVGISTVRAAIGELVSAKVLTRIQGKGTFVSLHNRGRNIYQFFHVVRDDGMKELPLSELVSFGKATADNETADLLQLPRRPDGARIYKMRNILRVAGAPVVVSDIAVPASLFPGMTAKILREGDTLYAVYQRRFGVNIVRTIEELKSLGGDASACGVFGLPKNAPLLEIRRTAYTFNELPVEVRVSRVDTRNYHYRLDQGEFS